MKGYRKILIAVNGSKDVLTEGLQLARDEKCWVTVVKVIPPYEGDLNLVGIKNIEAVLDSEGTKAVSEMKAIARTEGALIKTRLEEGEVDKKIIEVAEDERCDLIIMGAQKTGSPKSRRLFGVEMRNWLRKFFGDNVVEKVINQAPCPVLVVSN
ncbi:MAG: universal stress protein [Nitrospirae bacterium]|nr:universal stress protein [Nitrospirota bacterium]